ncbi:MAG: hypothetical protein IAC58_07080 [Firmicutes bacterium]|uniref:Uncharacterized protein n=1 Tax=Candidatus Onthovivens merdipullorum TaxID=2840889 RepID=A0A9D9GY72_9BACL|nr:hypothetical protein [Candidatus Onthovivens merdipullorum]
MQGQGNYFVIDYNDLINPNNFEWVKDNAVVGKLFLIENYPSFVHLSTYPYGQKIYTTLLMSYYENTNSTICFVDTQSNTYLELKKSEDDIIINKFPQKMLSVEDDPDLTEIYTLRERTDGVYTISNSSDFEKVIKYLDGGSVVRLRLDVYSHGDTSGNSMYVDLQKYPGQSAYYGFKIKGSGREEGVSNASLIILYYVGNKGEISFSELKLATTIYFGNISMSGGQLQYYTYWRLRNCVNENYPIYANFTYNGSSFNILPYIYDAGNDEICIFAYISAGISLTVIVKSDNTYIVQTHTDFLPIYSTLQVSGIESIPVNSSITTSINSLTDKNTTITSIKPSVAGVIVSAPYFDETDSCYKTTIFNATTSAVSGLTLTIDYYTLTQD